MISVCMATYNGEKYISEQIDSVLPQLIDDDELVISDDSSSDSTPEIIRNYAANEPRVKLYPSQHFHSPVLNFEYAISKASGDIIVLCDQDDIWLENKLNLVREFFESRTGKPCLAVFDAEVVDEKGDKLYPSVLDKIRAGRGFWKNLYDNRYLGCCMAFTKDLLDRALPFPANIPMHDIWLGQLCERIGRTEFVPVVTMKYRKHSDSLTDFKIQFRPLLQISRRLNLFRNLVCRAYLS